MTYSCQCRGPSKMNTWRLIVCTLCSLSEYNIDINRSLVVAHRAVLVPRHIVNLYKHPTSRPSPDDINHLQAIPIPPQIRRRPNMIGRPPSRLGPDDRCFREENSPSNTQAHLKRETLYPSTVNSRLLELENIYEIVGTVSNLRFADVILDVQLLFNQLFAP